MTPPTSQTQSQKETASIQDAADSVLTSPEKEGNSQDQDKAGQSKQTKLEKKQAKQALKAEKRKAKQRAKQQKGSRRQSLKAIFSKSQSAKSANTESANTKSGIAQAQSAEAKTSQTSSAIARTSQDAEALATQKRPSPAKPPSPPQPATSLNAHELVLGWFKAYPGLWLSPLVLGVLGGWVIAQPNSTATNTPTASAEIATQGTAEPLLSPFASRDTTAFDPSAPFGATDLEATATTSDGQLLADPPGATDLAKATLEQQALEKADQSQNADSATPTATSDPNALPGVPDVDETSKAAIPGVPTAQDNDQEKALAEQLAAQVASTATVSSADQAQAAADAKFVLEERAKAQAAAFSQAKANQAASETPPQPAPPIQGNPEVDQLITMQVAIAEGDTILSMGGSNKSVIMTQAGEPLLQLEAGDYGMQCDGTGLLLNGETLPATVMMAPLEGGLNYVRDRSYRGQIQFICQGNSVLAVNHIDMLHYLYSVVGSEVSASWAPAALKAQSVAARSYALTYYFRPAKEHFHIGDTESYQVYKGTVSEDDRVKAAVQATAGEFISYQGGIVESLYAASDDIVMEAFQGGGMSQLGARDFAEQGYNYLQILGYYYPQTSLGRMVIESGA